MYELATKKSARKNSTFDMVPLFSSLYAQIIAQLWLQHKIRLLPRQPGQGIYVTFLGQDKLTTFWALLGMDRRVSKEKLMVKGLWIIALCLHELKLFYATYWVEIFPYSWPPKKGHTQFDPCHVFIWVTAAVFAPLRRSTESFLRINPDFFLASP